MSTTIRRVTTICAATLGLAAAGVGVANASTTASAAPQADTTCLQESLTAVLSDPVGSAQGALADPAGSLQADLACVQEVLGI